MKKLLIPLVLLVMVGCKGTGKQPVPKLSKDSDYYIPAGNWTSDYEILIRDSNAKTIAYQKEKCDPFVIVDTQAFSKWTVFFKVKPIPFVKMAVLWGSDTIFIHHDSIIDKQ